MTIPVVTRRIDNLTVPENSADATFDLSLNFDDPFTTGQIARFEFADSSLGGGVTNVLLFDQTGAGAPATVANFLNYVEDDDYASSIIHRSVPGFIIQGGGFTVDSASKIAQIPADAAVGNEYSPQRSNTGGTIAMAKLGNDPNSATNQWFFNLGNNSANLDNQNGGFTVFGEVIAEADLAPIKAIASLPFFDASQFLAQSAFTNLPLIVEDPKQPKIDNVDNFVVLNSVSLLQEEELKFSVIGNDNPELVNAKISEGKLVLDYAAAQNGVARITVKATNLLGDSVEDRFIIAVGDAQPNLDPQDATVYRFLNQDTGVHLYTSSEVERAFIEDNLPNYIAEGSAYMSVDPFTGSPEPEKVYRFLNQDTGTHLYTTSEVEKQSVEDNLANFSLETEYFFAFGEQQPGTVPVYRFFNTETGAHFYTPSEVERQSVEETLPNYQAEGIAYYTFAIAE
ncbi:MAG TPA: peptidylprolyl isomerase [Coleofasciculaceae cyanobacterium]|jgi:peptidyl-prolyl cis-trans isomerase A (cyclophilin A)